MNAVTTSYAAPWGNLVKITSGLSCLLLIGTSLAGLLIESIGHWGWLLSMVILPLGILLFSALFMVRGYILTGHALLIKRLLWTTPIRLQGLESVVVDAKAMKGSIRTFGNGGLFSISGWFRNKRLGTYRAFATDTKRCVVLKFNHKVIVITPNKPHAFVTQLQAITGQVV